jgi:bacterioferritin
MTATVHPRVLAYLGRALSLELTAVQQYMTQASLAESWGDREAADRFRHETVEEMQHAERIVTRMISLGVAPGASQLKAVTTAPTLEGLLERNTDLEDQLIRHYAEASRFCQQIQDDGNRSFFEALLAEEQSHGREVASWLADQQGPMPVALERAPF